MTFTDTFGGTVIYPAQPSYKDYTSATADLSLSWPLETAPSNDVVAAINDIAFPTSGFTVTLAAASQISTGIAPLFNNLGSDSFTVLGASGATILTASAGAAWIAYLTDNSTTSGTWRTFQAGAGTSSASASALAGLGLVAITSTLNQEYGVTSTSTTPTTLAASDRASTIVWTGGAGVFNLTAAATLTNGWFANISNQGTGALVLTPSGGETVNSAATFTLNPSDSLILVSDGTSNFITLGFGQDSVFSFDFTSISLAGLSGTYTLSGSELNRIAYRFTGALAGAIDIIVPSTVQQYWVDNQTTGGFQFGVRTVTQASPGVVIAATARDILYSDGTDVVRAETVGIGSPVPIADGGTGATTASGARSNLDVPSTLDAFTLSLIAS